MIRKFLLTLLLFLALAIGVILINNRNINQEKVENDHIEKDNIDNEKKEVRESDNQKNIKVNAKEYEDQVLTYLEENFSQYGEISFDEESKTYNILPNNTKVSLAISSYKMTKGENDKLNSLWQEVEDGAVRGSENMAEKLPGYTIKILDPGNEDKALLEVKDGVITYNFTDTF